MKYLCLAFAIVLIPLSAWAQGQPPVMRPIDPPMVVTQTAIFAGGCFWCMESEFQDQKGVTDVVSGFAGAGDVAPTYEQVSKGGTGFKESIAVTYDPAIVTYDQLLSIFWSNVDPFDDEGQFCDKGDQYRAAIFYGTPDEEKAARASLEKIEKKHGQKVATLIEPKTNFYKAEDYHQDYYKTNSLKYKFYRGRCGRDDRLEEINGSAEEHKG